MAVDEQYAQAVRRLGQLERERDELRALWLEWLEGMYDGMDLLRRVKLAVHGPLRKPDSAANHPGVARFDRESK